MATTSVAPVAFVELGACLGDESQKLRWTSMHKLCSQFDRVISDAMSKDATADAVPCFNHGHLQSGLRESSSGGKTSDTGPDDQNLIVDH